MDEVVTHHRRLVWRREGLIDQLVPELLARGLSL
jgi:hypothetical protein